LSESAILNKPQQSFAQFIDLTARGYASVDAPPVVRARNVVEALSFYCAAFGARITARRHGADGPVEYGELSFGTLTVAIDGREAGQGAKGNLLTSATVIELPVSNVPAFVARAIRFGAGLQRQRISPERKIRSALLIDRYQVRWLITERH
jgi:uncharacterized glyoxalase superfamily protein PhnB